MGLKIIVGGQLGSEGKGKVAYLTAQRDDIMYNVRVGGPNSGHTVWHNGEKMTLRQLPTTALLEDRVSILSVGSYIDLEVLMSEIELVGVTPYTLQIDPYAVMVTKLDKYLEKSDNWDIGSTLTGTGRAVMSRIARRKGEIVFAKDEPVLQPYLANTKRTLRKLMDLKRTVLLEGNQGYGLSVLHTTCWPYATSRDTTAAGFLSEVGLSPFDVSDIIMVLRTYPIRSGGNTGPMVDEVSWDDLGLDPEFTSVTSKTRRVSHFDHKMVSDAVSVNQPTVVVLNHLDYIPEELRGEFVAGVELHTGCKINWVGLGPMDLTPNEH